MAAPKHGDRVRVVIEGIWWQSLNTKNEHSVRFATTGIGPGDLAGATVEVLASPVYANSDTTEFKAGDVARLDPSGVAMVYSDDKRWHYLSNVSVSASQLYTDETLTLLVRDGQVVQP